MNEDRRPGKGLEAVFRARAIELAARRESAEVADTLPVLAFVSGGERFGLALTDLVGVLAFGRCTPVPGGPSELLGVINNNGRICSVLDLARLLGLPPPAADGSPTRQRTIGGDEAHVAAYILLLRRSGAEIGLRVDSVEAIRQVAPNDLLTLGADATQGRANALSAIQRTRDGLTLLRAEAIWAHPTLAGEPSS